MRVLKWGHTTKCQLHTSKSYFKLTLEFRVALQRLVVEVLRRGAGLLALLSNLYLYEQVLAVGTLLLTCTSTDAATFFGFE